jgi:hypothetical protein
MIQINHPIAITAFMYANTAYNVYMLLEETNTHLITGEKINQTIDMSRFYGVSGLICVSISFKKTPGSNTDGVYMLNWWVLNTQLLLPDNRI